MAQQAGFEKINIDLMHGLPEQQVNDAKNDLITAINTGVTHLSWYQLTLEPNTLFYQRPPRLPDDEVLIDIQDMGEELLKSAGFKQYEVSAFARSTRVQSRHNLNYWMFGDYLAIGAGAHGKLTLPADNAIIRYSKFRNPKDYLDTTKPYEQTRKTVKPAELPLEFMMNALRLVEGVPEHYFFERTGLPLQLIEPQLNKAAQRDLIERTNGWLRATPLGHRFLNDLLDYFAEENFRLTENITIKQID
jgi:oxygen-independent coproporphyrinogen-3 oxidase